MRRYGRGAVTKLDAAKIAYLIEARKESNESCSNIALQLGVTKKELGRYVIPNYIIKMYDGNLIDDGIDKCEHCGSRHLQKHGARRKLFCTVILESGFKNVCIWRQCYKCMECHHVNVSGKDLFYDRCARHESLVRCN